MNISRRLILASASALISKQVLAFDSKKTITIVVGYQAGGGTDVIARLIAEKLQTKMGNPVIVVNKPGATGAISASFVEHAQPDGLTLLLTPGTFSYAQFVLGKASKSPSEMVYDPINSFAPVAHLADVPLFIVTHKNSGINSFNNIIEQSKTKTLSYGTTGTGGVFHIMGERINQFVSGNKLAHVPYKGVAPAVMDLVSGHIPLVFTSLDAVFPYLKDGSLKLLATTSPARSRFAPDIPTLKELGFNLDIYTWYGVFAPKKTPRTIIDTLNSHINSIVKDPVVISKAESILGADTKTSTPEDMDALNKKDFREYKAIIDKIDFN